MNIETSQQAHDAITDVVWWLKGFRASRNPEFDNDGLSHMISGLQDVSYFLTAEKENKDAHPR